MRTAAKRIVKKTCACITTEARLAGMPRASAAKSRPELRHAEKEAVGDDMAPVGLGPRDEDDGRQGGTGSATPRSSGGMVPTPSLMTTKLKPQMAVTRRAQAGVASGICEDPAAASLGQAKIVT